MTTAVVVGGGSGIGAAVAERQRLQGVEVLTWDLGDEADIRCDITDASQVDKATDATIERSRSPVLGDRDRRDRALRDSSSTPRPTTGIESWGSMPRGSGWSFGPCARRMLDSDGGSIVATSSVSARLADRSMGLYCVSKAALDMVIAVSALELAPTVRVNGVAPGVTDTPMLGPAPRDRGWLAGVAERTALGRLGTPDDIAEAVQALHETNWVTGQVLTCDGGLSLRSPIDPLGGFAH